MKAISVIKIGGSLMDFPEELKQLCMEIERLSARHQMIIIPGGGQFADCIRKIDRKFHFSPSTSHKMAILAMDQYGLFIRERMPGAKVLRSLGEAKKAGYAILLPSKLLFKVSEKTLPHSWDVTSDSIACHIAVKAKAEKLVLVKAVDGIYKDSKKLLHEVSASELKQSAETCIDRMLPDQLIRYQIACCVVNGRHPLRLRRVLEGKPAVCTWIKP